MLKESLNVGIECPERAGASIRYRYIQAHDAIDGITNMLHEAYAPLAQKGLRFLASHQH
jgi:hypothetical protein